MPLDTAISAALALRDLLTAEVARSQAARAILRSMRADALFEFASSREAFNQRSSHLAADLAQAIGAVAQEQGRTDVTLNELQATWPQEGQQLAAALAEIRALSAALKELDDLHQQMAARALTFVRAYVSHLSPRPTAYTRRGQPASFETGTRSEHA